MDYYVYIILALFVVMVFIFTRSLRDSCEADKEIVKCAVEWTLLIYSLILAFSIGIFYEKYTETRNIIFNQTTAISVLHRYFSVEPNAEEIVVKIKEYTETIHQNLDRYKDTGHLDKNHAAFDEMHTAIIEYLHENPNMTFKEDVLSKLNDIQKVKVLINDMKVGNHYIQIIWFLTFFLLVLLWVNSLEDLILEILTDLTIVIMAFSAIYLCDILNDPIKSSPISIDLNVYSELFKEIKV